jgi:RHS repeat-associated protein
MGNILTQKRNGGGTSATALDELTYNYHTTTDGLVSNRLYQVNDVVSAGNYTDDIDDQGTFNNTHSTIETANNYGYDELGNLVRDVQEEIASIEWTVYGKMKKITRNSGSTKADLEFGYDASGNRLWKKVTPKGSGAVTSTYYYLRDAQGNEMCRYVKYTNTTSQLMYVAQEHSIYGSSRVGVDGRKDTLYLGAAYTPTWGGANTSRRALGLKSFELANHLGNVLVTVSDKPIYKVSSGTIYFQPEVSSISDYYPFGAPIQGRSAAFGSEYRFGFNGKENDGESETQDYGMRINDCRLGRFLSVDPLAKEYAFYSTYHFAGNTPIAAIDLDGLEEFIVVKEFTKAKDGTTQLLKKSTEREVGWTFFGREIVGYEFKLDNKIYTANSNQTTFGRDPGVEGNFSGVHELTEEEMSTLFAKGFDVISRINNVDNAFLHESVGTGAQLDFKITLYSILEINDNDKLIKINGIVYNPNEAGNFIWGALNEYVDEVTNWTTIIDPSSLAQIGTLISQHRWDEKHEQKALDDGENYGIRLSENKKFNNKVREKINNKEMFDSSYIETNVKK